MMDFETLGRKELQALAKQYGIKANLSNAAIVEQLAQVLNKDFEEQQNIFLNEEEVKLEKEIEQSQSILGKRKSEVTQSLVEEHSKQPLEQEETHNIVLETATIAKIEADVEAGPFTVTPTELIQSDAQMSQECTMEESQCCDNAVVDDEIEVLQDGIWLLAVVKRVNKVSYRIIINGANKEITVKMSETRRPQPIIESTFIATSTSPVAELSQKVAEPVEVMTEPANEDEKDEDNDDDDDDDENYVDASYLETEEDMEVEEEFVDANEGHDESMCEEDNVVNEDSFDAESIDIGEEYGPQEGKEECEGSLCDVNVSMTIDTMENADDDLLFSTVCVPTPSAVKKPLERKSFAAVERKTPKKVRATELPPWNSCTKQATDSRLSIAPASEKKAPLSARKSFSTTPAVSLSAPSIVPKTNAAQRLRMEAMKKKNESSNLIPKTLALGSKVTPLTNKITPMTQKVSSLTAKVDSLKQTEKGKLFEKPREKAKVQFDVAQKTSATTIPASSNSGKASGSSVSKKATPNFSKMHQKQFNSSKSIASFVERNQDITKKMDEAFEAASNGSLRDAAVAMASKVKPLVSTKANTVVSKPIVKAKNLETKKTSFLSETSGGNAKENGSFINSFLSNNGSGKVATVSTRVGPKEVSINQLVSKREERRDTFAHDAKKKRNDVIATKRRSVVEATPHNPFHYVA